MVNGITIEKPNKVLKKSLWGKKPKGLTKITVPITTDVVSSNLDQGEMYNVIKFVSDLRQVGGFLRVFRLFPSPIKLTDTI